MATINKAMFSYEFRGVLERETRVRIRAGDAGTGPVEIELEIGGQFKRATVPHFEWIRALHTMALLGINPIYEVAFAFDGSSSVAINETTAAEQAEKFGVHAVELAKARGLEGPASHAMWTEIAHHSAVAFYVGFYAGRGRRSLVDDLNALHAVHAGDEATALKGDDDNG